MAERTFKELEAEIEAGKKILNEMYESDKYTSQQRLEQSQKIDPLVIEIMIISRRIDKMIKDYSLKLVKGKISSDTWLVNGNQDDFKFFKKNKSAFLNRLVEIETKKRRF